MSLNSPDVIGRHFDDLHNLTQNLAIFRSNFHADDIELKQSPLRQFHQLGARDGEEFADVRFGVIAGIDGFEGDQQLLFVRPHRADGQSARLRRFEDDGFQVVKSIDKVRQRGYDEFAVDAVGADNFTDRN